MEMIYLDNAATTPLLPEVIDAMSAHMKSTYGNPSSSHALGRKSRASIEQARKKIASIFNCHPGEVYFTAGGSEADNLVLHNAVINWGVKRIISSKIEHHAVLHTIEYLSKTYDINLEWVNIDSKGQVDLDHLKTLLSAHSEKSLVSLMHVNNEIGTLLDLDSVTAICKEHQAIFHSDTVQGVAHLPIDLSKTPVDCIAASAHKFHGPKGVGFAIVNKQLHLEPLIHGGEQEKGSRAGTENIHSIIGMEKALDLAFVDFESDRKKLLDLKSYFIKSLEREVNNVSFNGTSGDLNNGAPHILSVRFPRSVPMMLFQLDLAGIAASGGSACQSGSNKGSHVLEAITDPEEAQKTTVRFSFNKHNSKQEIDKVIATLLKILGGN